MMKKFYIVPEAEEVVALRCDILVSSITSLEEGDEYMVF